MSPRTATNEITLTNDNVEPSTEPQFAEDSMPTSSTSESREAISMDSSSVAILDQSPADAAAASEPTPDLERASAGPQTESQAKPNVDIADVASEPQPGSDTEHVDAGATHDTECSTTTQELTPSDGPDQLNSQDDYSSSTLNPRAQAVTAGVDEPQTLTPELPDASSISGRLRHLVVAVAEVEELSRRAREAAASDLALYDGIAKSQRQFEEGLAEAQRIGREAEDVYRRAFGRDAKAVAEPAIVEAREVEQAFAELADAWRHEAEMFLLEHPDVESLLAEQQHEHEQARRRQIARAKAERFQQLVNGTDAALRQDLLDDARDCLRMLHNEFPAEADRVKPLHDRLQHRVRAANDAAASCVMVQASELQGRGDFNAAVRLLEAVDVEGLSREASEDVFGRWSAACSLVGQAEGLELLRYSAAQGRGIILQVDPSVPYGLVEFSSLGMGSSHRNGRIVSAADREGALIISRARPFRAAELPGELSVTWYARSYVIPGGSAAVPVRH